MSRSALPFAALLLVLGGTAWWLLAGSGADRSNSAAEVTEAARAAPDPGRLPDEGVHSGEEPAEPDPEAATSRSTVGEEPRQAPAAWFRGRLRIVAGSLALAPRLQAILLDADGSGAPQPLRVDAASLSFEIPAWSTELHCRLSFPDHLAPVAAFGGATLSEGAVSLPGPGDGFLIDVAAKPHLAVQFLHDPSGEPLAQARVTSQLSAQGGATSWSELLDDQGMLIFDLERRRNMEHAEFLSFTVARPPDVGSSDSAPIPCADLALLPQPLILRFASTPRLRFRIVDPQREPIEGAQVWLGGGAIFEFSEQLSDEQGRASAPQSSPPVGQVRVQADGFLTAEEPLTAASEVEQEVMLWPSSWIEVVGAEAPDEGWAQLDLEIRFDGNADGSLLSTQRFQTGRFTESSGGTGTESSRERRYYKHTTSFSPQGRAKLDGIHVDVPATVRVTYRGATMLETRVPIRPGDGGHLVEVPNLPELVEVRGRVVDRAGAPIAGVEIRARFSPRDSASIESGADGEFRAGGLVPGMSVRLVFMEPGYGCEVLDYLVEARDDDSVGDVVLAPAASLTVLVLRPDGSPYVAQPGMVGVGFAPRVMWREVAISPSADRSGLSAGEWRYLEVPAHGTGMLLQYPGERMFSHAEQELPAGAARCTITLSEKAAAWLDQRE